VNDLLVLLGKRVQALRATKKWSQEEFAYVSGLHRTYIGQIERGEKNISFDNLSRVAGALGVTLSALLEGLENGSATNLKSPQVETGSRGVKETAHKQLETQKLLKRLKLQHAEMNRTILALENLPAKDSRRPKPSRGRTSK
jgi:transcriptional regulator with XRE-family HTH domain